MLLLVLALFAPGSAFGRILYACAMSGKVSAGRCCCHAKHASPPAEQQRQAQPPKLERPGCCEAQDHRRSATPASSPNVDIQVLAAAPTELLPTLEPAADASNVLRPLSHAARGPPHDLPVYAVNCSLLI